MSDYSLMNPDHLKSEIEDVETILIPKTEKLANDLHEDCKRILGYVRDTHNRGESTILTPEQVSDMIQVLTKFDLHRWRYADSYKFAIRVYKKLLKDRRWIIGSKLRFLKK